MSNDNGFVRSIISIGSSGITSGKVYFEITIEEINGYGMEIGLVDKNVEPTSSNAANIATNCYLYKSNGNLIVDGNLTNPFGASYTVGDVIGIAIDIDNGKIWFSKNGIYQGNQNGDPQTGVYPAVSNIANVPLFIVFSLLDTGNKVTLNAGDSDFSHCPPGYKGIYYYSTNDFEWITINEDNSTILGRIFEKYDSSGSLDWDDLVEGVSGRTINSNINPSYDTRYSTIGYQTGTERKIFRTYLKFTIGDDNSIRGKKIIEAKLYLYRYNRNGNSIDVSIKKATDEFYNSVSYEYFGSENFSDSLGTFSLSDQTELIEVDLNSRGVIYLNEILNETENDAYLQFNLMEKNYDYGKTYPGDTKTGKNYIDFSSGYVPYLKCKVVNNELDGILLTDTQMDCTNSQTLTSNSGNSVTWKIVGGGSFSNTETLIEKNGESVTLYPPATNENCENNATIKIYDGNDNLLDEVDIYYSCVSSSSVAGVEFDYPYLCTNPLNGWGYSGTNCYGYTNNPIKAIDIKCDGSLEDNSITRGQCDGGSFGGGGYNEETCRDERWLELECNTYQGYVCSKSVTLNGITQTVRSTQPAYDFRSASLKANGCCPEQLL